MYVFQELGSKEWVPVAIDDAIDLIEMFREDHEEYDDELFPAPYFLRLAREGSVVNLDGDLLAWIPNPPKTTSSE